MRALDFDPSLSEARWLIADAFYVDIALLTRVIVPVKQITNMLTIYFQCADFYIYFLTKLFPISFDLVLYKNRHSRQDPSIIMHFLCGGINQFLRLWWPLHGVRLARSCLTVGKNADVFAIESRLDEWFDFLEYFFLF